GPQLDHQDLKQVDEFDLEAMDLKLQTGKNLHFDAKEPIGFHKRKVCFNCHNTRHFAREYRSKGNQDSRRRDARNTRYNAIDNGKRPVKQDEHKPMVTVHGEGVDWTGHAKDEIEDYALMAYNSSNSSSDTEMSAKDKSGLGYRSQIHDGVLSYEKEVFASVFDSRSSDVEDSTVTDRFAKVEVMHVVPPLMTGNYMPPKSNFRIDETKFTYGPKQFKTSESNAKTSDLDSCDSNSSVETLESIPKLVANETTADNPHQTLKGKGIIDRGCSWHMTWNKTYLVDYQDFPGGPIAFRGSKGQITGKGIEREYSNARTSQQNRVAERKNKNLIEAARTMLADLFLPNTFWAEAISIVCYVLNRVLVTKPQNKTPYELITGKIPIINYIRPFGCHVTILNTIDYLGKFEEKSDEGFLVRCSLNSKAFRPVTAENKSNITTGLKEADNSAEAKNGDEKINGYTCSKINEEPIDQEDQSFLEELKRLKRQEKEADDAAETLRKTFAQGTEDLLLQAGASRDSSTNYVNTVSTPVNTTSPSRNIPSLEDIYEVPNDGIFTNASYDDEGAVANFTNLESTMNVGSQGHRQEEGIDYDEVIALMARIETIRIFLAFVSYMGFIVYQMDVKSTLFYAKNDEEVYVSQPLGFIDTKFPKKVYKVVKALYGLHQAPRAWYATLSTFLVQSGYRRGLIDKTLFINKDKKDIILVQVYVDHIIFGSTKNSWCDEFDVLIKSRFQMNSMGELAFFLGLQVTPKTSHLHVVKRIFRYLKGQPKLRKSTTGGCQFLGRRLITWQCKKQTIVATSTTEAEYIVAASCCGQVL
nr:retrovirus-related Pol polyprotein from transposon TNT 1-94 [Tanacetum cinerariifolium]